VSYQEQRTLEVRGRYDVVVVGGGPSGIVAAIAAARHGMQVLLLEKHVILGGLATGGHVCLFEPLCDGKGRQVTAGLVEEMFYKSIQYSYNTLPPHWKRGVRSVKDPENCEALVEEYVMKERGRYCSLFNIPAFALALEEMLRSEQVTIQYDTLFCDVVMDGNRVKAVVVEEAAGRFAIECGAVIDATGASMVFQRAGAECVLNTNRLTYVFIPCHRNGIPFQEDLCCGQRVILHTGVRRNETLCSSKSFLELILCERLLEGAALEQKYGIS